MSRSFVLIRFVISELLPQVDCLVGHGCGFQVVCGSPDSSLQSQGQEKHFGILVIPLHVVCDLQLFNIGIATAFSGSVS